MQNTESGVTIDTQDFVPATTVKEAEEQAKEFSENVNYSGVKNVDALNTVNQTLKRLTTEFPIDKLETITVKKLGKNIYASANAKGLNIDTGYLNKTPERVDRKAQIAEYRKIIKKAQKDIESGRYPKGYVNKLKDYIKQMEERLKYSRWGVSDSSDNPLSTVIAHEYGHVLAKQYFGLNEYKPSYEIYVRGNHSRWLVDSTYNKAKETGDIFKISQYANKNSSEFFSECFAAHINGEQLPDYIEKMLKETLKK